MITKFKIFEYIVEAKTETETLINLKNLYDKFQDSYQLVDYIKDKIIGKHIKVEKKDMEDGKNF
jgi:hypothetical protein